MKFKTAISKVNEGDEIIRGEKLHDLMKNKNFVEVVYLVLRGVLPSKHEAAMFNTVLISMVDHGPGVSSALTTRIVQSAGNELHTAVGAGVLALGGTRHGGALAGAATFFKEHLHDPDLTSLLTELKEKKVRIPGFGHKVLTHDKRTDVLFEVAKENNFFDQHCVFALKVYEELNKISSKPLPLNMDGANAAVLLDMGFDPCMVTGLFIISRSVGLVAHAFEEMSSGEGIRRIDEEEIEYSGK